MVCHSGGAYQATNTGLARAWTLQNEGRRISLWLYFELSRFNSTFDGTGVANLAELIAASAERRSKAQYAAEGPWGELGGERGVPSDRLRVSLASQPSKADS